MSAQKLQQTLEYLLYLFENYKIIEIYKNIYGSIKEYHSPLHFMWERKYELLIY